MLNIITKDCELTAKEKLVAQYFVYKSNKSGACYPCVATIAEECSVSRRTVQRATKKLAEKEYIIKEERFKLGKQTSNLYSFNILILDEMEVKEEESKSFVQEEQMEVIELSDLLQVQENEEYFEPVPEEFIHDEQDEDEGIDLDELASLSMEELYENDYITSMPDDSIAHYEFAKKPGLLELEKENRKQAIQGNISFSVIMYVVIFLHERTTVPDQILIHVTLLTIIQQHCIASRKIMGAFFPP